jgi:PIN domain nuclease of toxin-antitoxin system
MLAVVDTHALAWWLEDNPRLSHAAREALEGCTRPLLVPAIVLAELAYMGKKRGDPARMMQLIEELRLSDDMLVLPFTEAELSLLDFRLDIHDSIIVACALAFGKRSGETVMLITKDESITASGLVATIW